MIPIVCSAVAVSACDASSAGLCVVQVFGGGRRAGARKGVQWLGGAMYSPEEGDMKQDGGKGLGEKEGGGGVGVCGPE